MIKPLTVHVASAVLVLTLSASQLRAQALRFSNRREVARPDYATLRIGPFYSTAAFSQSLGYRWTRSHGSGTDFLIANRRGVIREEGSEFPMISTLTFRNYLLITRNTDLDASIRMSYEYYPLDTQDDQFNVDMVEEGVYGTLSMEYRLTPVVKGTLYDNFTYRTDYVDTRGLTDRFGGQQFEYMRNRFGSNLDWLMAKNKSLGLDLSRMDMVPRDDEFEDQERVSYNESLTYEHLIIPRLVLGARAGVTQTDYEVDTRPKTRNYNYSIFGRYNYGQGEQEGVRLRLTEFSTLAAGIGYSIGAGAGRAITGTGGDITETQRVTAAENDVETATGFIRLSTQLREDLSHRLGYSRRVRTGYKAAFETLDSYDYRLRWDGDATKASLYSKLNVVEPSSVGVREYDDWTSGVTVDYPLVRYITLHMLSAYTVRRNRGTVLDEADVPTEELFDHTTWRSRIGTSFRLTRSVTFNTYVQRVKRESDSDDLAFVRNIFEATLKYSHQF